MLSFTPPSDGKHFRHRNFDYESVKRLGGYDVQSNASFIDIISGRLIENPVTAPCTHTFDASSTYKRGATCPYDGCPVTEETVYPNLFLTSYIRHLLAKEYIVPTDVEGVYLDLPLHHTMLELGIIAKDIAGSERFKNLQLTDGSNSIPFNTTLESLLSSTPEDIIPYVFAFDYT